MQAVEVPNQNHSTQKLKQGSHYPQKIALDNVKQIEDQRRHDFNKDKQ